MKYNSLDKIDQTIIKLLSENSRISYVEISQKVGLSRVAVKQRIKNMEEIGVIEKYSIVINPQKMGRTVSAFFDIEVEPNKLYEVANQLSKNDCITDIYQMTGQANLHVHGLMKLNEDLTEFLEKELYVLDGIKKIDCKLILSRIKTRNSMKI
ncbi:Lrp/AsnC family transcriptional regulator [Clostridiaceae bacterium 35-E11]